MGNPFAPLEQGLTVHQSTHEVTIEETNGNFVQYSLLVDGTVSGVETNPADHTVSFNGFTVVNGGVKGGHDTWSVDGGIVDFFASAEVTITLDGQQVTGSGLVSNTGGTHPSNVERPQCQGDAECAGPLLCEGGECVMPPLEEIPQCTTDQHCVGNLVCQSGMCAVPQGAGTSDDGSTNGGSTDGGSNGENGGSAQQSIGGTTVLAVVVGVLVLAYVYGAV